MAEKILEVQNLKKTFLSGKKSFTAVEDVSFFLNAGEVLGIVGESGSGKSTVAKMITHLTDITDGKIFFLGKDITHAKGKALRETYRELQMVFQTPAGSFDPRCTIGDGIGESLRNMGISKKETRNRVEKLLLTCGLTPEYADRYPHQVSGGECQRAAIARALAVEPKVLICDEATSALDVTVQKQIMELLMKLKKEKQLSFLFICHDLALVQMFCDRVIVMHDGHVEEEGTPEEIIENPKTEYTKRLIIQRRKNEALSSANTEGFFVCYTLTQFPSPDIIKKESKPDENGINNIEETTKNGRKFTDQTCRSKGGRPSGRNRGNLFPACGGSKS